MDWIPVKKQMPEPDTAVLVWVGKYHWLAQYDSTYGFWRPHYESVYWREPTHWMPLPAPPNKPAQPLDRNEGQP